MPCTQGMRSCHSHCLHRDMVQGYRSARAASVVESESLEHGGYAARDDENAHKPLTYKQWLKSNRRH